MTSKIFSVATFIVVSWLAVTVLTTSKRLNTLEIRLIQGMASSVSAMDARITTMENTQQQNHHSLLAQLQQQPEAPIAEATSATTAPDPTQINRLKARNEELEQQLAGNYKFGELKKAYNDIIESELEKYNNPTQAAERLLSTKGIIWKTSTDHPELQNSLQALMAPIDITASRWKSGDTDGTVRPIYKVLKQTLTSLDTSS